MKQISDLLNKTKEIPSHEGGIYNRADLDVLYVLHLINSYPNWRTLVCVPNFRMCVSDNYRVSFTKVNGSCTTKALRINIRAGVVVLNTQAPGSLTLHTPPSLHRVLADCASKGTRFAVCNIGLYLTRTFENGHSNALLMDLKNKVIERFEPDHRRQRCCPLDDALKRSFGHILPDWSYFGSRAAFGVVRDGPQQRVDAYRGMCVTYSLWYILMRALNPDKPASSVYEYFARLASSTLRSQLMKLNKAAVATHAYDRGSATGSPHTRRLHTGKKSACMKRKVSRKRSSKKRRKSPQETIFERSAVTVIVHTRD